MNVLSGSDINDVKIIDPCTVVVVLRENINDRVLDTTNLQLQVSSYSDILQKGYPTCFEVPLTRTICSKLVFAKTSGYYAECDKISFCLPEYRVKYLDLSKHSLFLAADFNNWFEATRDTKFQLNYTVIDNEPYFSVQIARAEIPENFQFKFVTSGGEWVGPTLETVNKVYAPNNIYNYYFDAKKTGEHIIALHSNEPLLLCDKFTLKIGELERIVDPTPWLLSTYTNAELGANIQNNFTNFRIFIPRAHAVRLLLYRDVHDTPTITTMHRNNDCTWETTISQNLHGYFYHYQALFFEQTNWEDAEKILDPYAKATYSPDGPGIILKKRTFLPLRDNFRTHDIKDDVILEAHVRDLLAHAPIKLTDKQRTTFKGLSKWLSKKRCYLRKLGINTLELQPIQEPDAKDKKEYHWGYMPVNFFSPASIYTTSPKQAPRELKMLIKRCHRANIAVILDVVYNHVGNPNHLYNIDCDYFFRKNSDGTLQNFSGCGNDLRTESPMVHRLIIDSLVHFITAYRIDGFRFDLAELLGREFLCQLEHELRSVKNDIQIIYEPWSFRGNIGQQLHNSSASAWNDEFREFVKNYVRGHGNFDGMAYFLRGSLGFRSNFPAQSINYVASHDDLCWIDKITENPGHNGTTPTLIDIKRTHLALAIMMMSIGVPMLAEGQDMLFSKHGYCNTYLAGDINAIDYALLDRHAQTHKFFKRWIKFRLSRRGIVTRPINNPTENFMRFFRSVNNSALGVLYNADRSMPTKQIFFAVNPNNYTVGIKLEDFSLTKFRKLSDVDKFFQFSKKFEDIITGDQLIMPPLSLGLWIE
ncbi:MAG: glycoside hydrolase family 1 [Opitutales bacterium]|nr:glycoside hydrolase family 1 [Opitutales bacterium]